MAGDCLCVNKGLPLPLLLLWDRANVYVQKLQDTMFSLPLFNFSFFSFNRISSNILVLDFLC
ncbi:unnamed protein product [Prunus brigantina]